MLAESIECFNPVILQARHFSVYIRLKFMQRPVINHMLINIPVAFGLPIAFDITLMRKHTALLI